MAVHHTIPISEALPPPELIVGGDEVHVWWLPLDLPADDLPAMEAVLSGEECVRADRFRFPGIRNRWIVGRALLKTILGWYVHQTPREIQFQYNSFGKPSLPAKTFGAGVSFNFSHSDSIAVLGVARGRQLGVDVERLDPAIDPLEIARHFFSDREKTDLASLHEDLQREAFFRCWTRKEAYIKARGMGLSLPLGQFAVSFLPGQRPCLLAHSEDVHELKRWSFVELNTVSGFSASLVVEGESVSVRPMMRDSLLTCVQQYLACEDVERAH